MHTPGRPRVLDDIKRGQICTLVAAGCGLAAAARFVGCSANTIRREALRNEEFRSDLRGAELRGQLEPLHALRNASKNHWRAAAWLLERANPEQFDRRRPLECKPNHLHDVVDALLDAIGEEVPDAARRDRLRRRLLVTAYQASRALTAAQRLRLAPDAGPFDVPTTAEQRSLDKLMAEVEEARLSALRSLKQENQNPRNCA